MITRADSVIDYSCAVSSRDGHPLGGHPSRELVAAASAADDGLVDAFHEIDGTWTYIPPEAVDYVGYYWPHAVSTVRVVAADAYPTPASLASLASRSEHMWREGLCGRELGPLAYDRRTMSRYRSAEARVRGLWAEVRSSGSTARSQHRALDLAAELAWEHLRNDSVEMAAIDLLTSRPDRE